MELELFVFCPLYCDVFFSQLEECALQLAPNGNYLDLESSLAEQRDDLEQFYDDVA